MPQPLADVVDDLARPLAEAAGLDLLDVQVKGSGRRQQVKVVVDRKGGVDVGTCQALSRQLGDALDAQDPIADRYTLEVTSPGTSWPLRDQRDFDRVEGRTVKAVLADPGDDDPDRTVQVVGEVVGAGPEAVVLRDADGQDHQVAYDRIRKATQELRW